jgi:hypothetical protein
MIKETKDGDKTEEIVKAVEALNKAGLVREVKEALDETLDTCHELEEPNPQVLHVWSREAKLVLDNQATILRVLQYLLAGGH